MTLKKQFHVDREKRAHKTRAENHISEKHLKNAIRGKSFNLDTLDDGEQDELGIGGYDDYTARDFLL